MFNYSAILSENPECPRFELPSLTESRLYNYEIQARHSLANSTFVRPR